MKINKKEMNTIDLSAKRAELNLETAKIEWSQLQHFFANGSVVVVAADLDLIRVAEAMSEDDTNQVAVWMKHGKVQLVSTAQAKAWHQVNAIFWAVVIRPLVLIQET